MPATTPPPSLVAPPVRRVAVIFNPAAGRRRHRRLVRVLAELERRGVVTTLYATAEGGDARRLASGIRGTDCDRLAVAGGDGTINDAINGLADRDVPLAVIPLGTANVLAREIGLASGPKAIARTIVEGRVESVALGRVNERRFIAMAGVGLDAHVVEAVSPRLKRWIGAAAYAIEILHQIVRRRPRHYQVVVDGSVRTAASVIVARGRLYGGRFVLAPNARLDDPRFNVCLFQSERRRDLVRYVVALMLGRLWRLADVTIVQALQVEIAGPASEPVQADGELVARLPALFTIEPDGLRLVVPR